jgi:tripartite ATP-independent transporter DctP family solute receptor
MKKIERVSLLMIVFLVSMFFLSMQVSYVSAADVTVLRFSGHHPIGHHCSRGLEFYAKLVMEKTNKVKIEVYPAGQLLSDRDLIKALPAGAVEMGYLHTGLVSGAMPSVMFLELPFLFKDLSHFRRVVDSQAGEILKQDYEKKMGCQFLYWVEQGILDFASKMPLKTLEDFKGKRIRGAGEMQGEALQAMGASPTTLGFGEVYMALQRNTIDGAISARDTYWRMKFFEVTKYLTDPDYAFGVFGAVINKKIWEGLPKDVQTIMLAAGKETQAWVRKEAEKTDIECLELLKKNGMDYYHVPEKERDRWSAKTTKVCTDLFVKRTGDPEKAKAILDIVEKLR